MTLDILLRETRKRWTGSRWGIVRPLRFSRATSTNAAARVWSAVTVPNVTRRGLPSRRSRSTQNLDPSGRTRSMIPRSVASRIARSRPRGCAASVRASLRRMRSAEDAAAASRRRLDRGCATPLRNRHRPSLLPPLRNIRLDPEVRRSSQSAIRTRKPSPRIARSRFPVAYSVTTQHVGTPSPSKTAQRFSPGLLSAALMRDG